MKTIRIVLLLIVAGLLSGLATNACGKSDDPDIRPPAVAGQFYPKNPDHLRLAIQRYLGDAVSVAVEKPIAILVPHAGYLFAGQIIADGYRQVKDNHYDTVVILGTNHTGGDPGQVSIFSRGGYQTPLGTARVDEEAAAALLSADKDCTANREAHVREHSVEVQVPFIQTLFPAARILPVVVGTDDFRKRILFGKALARVLKGRKSLIVISSDLSHYPPYEDAVREDHATLASILRLDPKAFQERIGTSFAGTRNLVTYACGEAPITSGLAAAASLGATSATLVSYANSGDMAAAGDLSRVVGYGAVIFAAGAAHPAAHTSAPASTDPQSSALPLQETDKRNLLKIARETIERFLTTETLPLVRGYSQRLQSDQGAFVTLREHGELRGCIGHIPPDFQLCRTVSGMAAQAAFNDPRFRPVQNGELEQIEIEVSVLTPMKPVSKVDEIKIGRDGIVLFKDGKSAVFLPQVAIEQKWGRDETLDNLCLKGGFPAGCWKSGARFQVFQAEVFSESEFK